LSGIRDPIVATTPSDVGFRITVLLRILTFVVLNAGFPFSSPSKRSVWADPGSRITDPGEFPGE